jgi:hypothetical protein
MTYSVGQLKAWAAEGVAAWQQSMPPDVTLSAQVPDSDAVFFTVVRGRMGERVKVTAERMPDPDAWALATLLGSVQQGRLRPLRVGRVPLVRMLPLSEQKAALTQGEGTVYLRAALPDVEVRRVVLAAVRAGRGHLEVRGNETWYVNSQFGRDVRTQDLRYDPEKGLVVEV